MLFDNSTEDPPVNIEMLTESEVTQRLEDIIFEVKRVLKTLQSLNTNKEF